MQGEIAYRFVHRETAWKSEHRGLCKSFGLMYLAGEQQLPDNRDGMACCRVVSIADLSVPESIIADLDVLMVWNPEYHSAEPAVANRKRHSPLLGRLFEPQQATCTPLRQPCGQCRGTAFLQLRQAQCSQTRLPKKVASRMFQCSSTAVSSMMVRRLLAGMVT